MPHTGHAGAAPSTGAGMLRPIDQSSFPDDEARARPVLANFQLALASPRTSRRWLQAGAVISLSGQTIVLMGVSSSSLTAQDFAFA